MKKIIRIKKAQDKISEEKIKFNYINDILEIDCLCDSVNIKVNDLRDNFFTNSNFFKGDEFIQQLLVR